MLHAIFVPLLGLAILFASGVRICAMFPSLKLPIALLAVASPLIARTPFLTWCLIGSLALILRAAATFFERRRFVDVSSALPSILDGVVLSMQAGRPLKFALREISRELSPPVARRVAELADRLDLAGGEDGLPRAEREILSRFRAASSATARTIERIESWRRSLKIETEFRRRSAQVTLQIRAQAGLSAALFVPALIWNWRNPGPAAFTRSVLALGLFVLAQIWIQKGFGKRKWIV